MLMRDCLRRRARRWRRRGCELLEEELLDELLETAVLKLEVEGTDEVVDEGERVAESPWWALVMPGGVVRGR